MTSEGVLCAISREAIVAERIAQIGDTIMMHRQSEFDEAFRQILGMGGASMNYGVFKTVVGSLMQNTVPGWYHVSNNTQKKNQCSDYAKHYTTAKKKHPNQLGYLVGIWL